MQLQLQILGAELQNGGRSRYAEKAGCEKQGGPLLGSWQFCKENSLTDEKWQFCCPYCGKVVSSGLRYSSRIQIVWILRRFQRKYVLLFLKDSGWALGVSHV